MMVRLKGKPIALVGDYGAALISPTPGNEIRCESDVIRMFGKGSEVHSMWLRATEPMARICDCDECVVREIMER